MKKSICIVLFIVLLSGTVFALELSNSTFSGGAGFDFIDCAGKSYDTNGDFSSSVYGVSLYGTYDLKIGGVWYSRIEYDMILFPMSFTFKDNEYAKDSGFRRSASKNRVGGYLSLDMKDRQHVNLGGAVTTTTVRLTSADMNDKFTNTLISLCLIVEWQYDLGDHFAVRFSVDPDVAFFTVDERDHTGEDGYSEKQTRGAFNISFFIGARLGISYKFR